MKEQNSNSLDIDLDLRNYASRYLDKGLCVLPGKKGTKIPNIGSWKEFQQRLPVESELNEWFKNIHGILCLVCGKISGNLEVIDFDCEGEKFNGWMNYLKEENSALLKKLVIESTPSGGFHVYFYCNEIEIPRSSILAKKLIPTPDDREIGVYGKSYKPKKLQDGSYGVVLGLIETRGEGSLSVCAPSPGYILVQGQIENIPEITAEERELIYEAARYQNEYFELIKQDEVIDLRTKTSVNHDSDCERPGDEFNIKGNVREYLVKHGWQQSRKGENEHWVRPGKKVSDGNSATLKDNVFYVFSSSAAPFESGRGYSPFQVYTHLEHGGDFSAAAKALRLEGYGEDDSFERLKEKAKGFVILDPFSQPATPIQEPNKSSEKKEVVYEDPGQLPIELIRVPGYISEFIDYSLETAPYPNQIMSFCAGLAYQGFLAGRKVMEPGGLRSNLYILGLGHSASGKDWPRKICKNITYKVGLNRAIGEKLSSGQALEDALLNEPNMLFLYDEFDTLLQSLGQEKTDKSIESMIANLLTIFTSADQPYYIRHKANSEYLGTIMQPCLNLFGTAIPNHYYDAVSVRLLTNGLFARMIVIEGATRGEGQEPKPLHEIPKRILETSKYWSKMVVKCGSDRTPIPRIVERDDQAKKALREFREEIDPIYKKSELANDQVSAAIWGRVGEQVRKLTLIYAISENPNAPVISKNAVEWAKKFIMFTTQRMLFQAFGRVADNPFHKNCLKLKRKIEESPNKFIPHSVLLKRMKLDKNTFSNIIETLIDQGDICLDHVEWGGKTKRGYKIA